MGVLSRGSPNVYPDRVILAEILWASNCSRLGSSPRRKPSHAVKSRDCRECALALQRRPGLMRSENTRLVIISSCANYLDFAPRSQTPSSPNKT